MGRGFYAFWIIGSAVMAFVTIIGLGTLSGMALTTTGYIPTPPWLEFVAIAAGLLFYWSVLCWGLALLRKRPVVSAGLVGAALLLAFTYPLYDAQSYAKQRASVAAKAVVGPKPEFAGKTAVLLEGLYDQCINNCWNISQHMAARVLLVKHEDLLAADFDGSVDLLSLPFYELDDTTLREVSARPARIDYVLINERDASDFDDAFERFRPRGIDRGGLKIDALIVPTRDGRHIDLTQDAPVLRLLNVSRNLASNPWILGAGRKLYWNAADRRANGGVAVDYFCTSKEGDDWHWCNNAFD